MSDFKRPSLTSGVYYKDPKAALKWLEEAFGFEPLMVVVNEDGTIGHSEMRFGDGMIYVGREWDADHVSPASLGGKNTQSLHLQVESGIDQLFVDTAGRLHTKEHLMAELGKVRRVIDREAADWRRRTLLVLDATTGQNALAQARTFSQVVPVDGVLLAKLDGTAKGGMAVAVSRELGLPVLYLGVGESADDLVEFRPREFAAALLG